ncbi:hypothetical protein MRX96_012088 [Rhipicephalus microplus]
MDHCRLSGGHSSLTARSINCRDAAISSRASSRIVTTGSADALTAEEKEDALGAIPGRILWPPNLLVDRSSCWTWCTAGNLDIRAGAYTACGRAPKGWDSLPVPMRPQLTLIVGPSISHELGDNGYVHKTCIEQSVTQSGVTSCESCGYRFRIRTECQPLLQWLVSVECRDDVVMLLLNLILSFGDVLAFTLAWLRALTYLEEEQGTPQANNLVISALLSCITCFWSWFLGYRLWYGPPHGTAQS